MMETCRLKLPPEQCLSCPVFAKCEIVAKLNDRAQERKEVLTKKQIISKTLVEVVASQLPETKDESDEVKAARKAIFDYLYGPDSSPE